MSQYHLDALNHVVIDDYDALPPFASFLPGIAGPLGVPLWTFYVNRGQAIASFGVESKDAPIMEFQPANKAYQTVAYTGFRTFIKLRDAAGELYYEPFSAGAPTSLAVSPPRGAVGGKNGSRRMIIAANDLALEETSVLHGLRTSIVYFILPGEPFAGLVRQVTVTNTGSGSKTLELLDGLPCIVPFGINDDLLKKMSRTAEAWMAVTNVENGVPFFRVQASVGDEAEVDSVEAGNFYLASVETPHPSGLTLFVDPATIFGTNTALSFPDRFMTQPLEQLRSLRQITEGRTPCAMCGVTADLGPGESVLLQAIVGHASDVAVIVRERERLAQPATIAGKRADAQALALALTEPVATQSADPLFDAYCRQSLLDNTLRGGWPVQLGGQIYHLYGRKHGDLERDYNAFYLAPEFYSQGNANYRDVAQNRRSDVLLNPAVGDFDVLAFLGLIQADGYNPLVVNGSRYTVPASRQIGLLSLVDAPEALRPLLSQPFTPGGLLQDIADREIVLAVSPQEFIAAVLTQAEASFEATFGEGYWVDHWTYNLDLLDAYLAVYPDRKDGLLHDRPVIPWFDSPAFVQPRRDKTVLAGPGRVRQYGAVIFDEEKAALIASRSETPNLTRTAYGRGEVFRSTVFGKLLGLALIKFATLDPLGMGIEMEAGKPGWCDALNGLPGLFGSSMSETYELLRLLDFLLAEVTGGEEDAPPVGDPGRRAATLPIEQAVLLQELGDQLAAHHEGTSADGDFRYWDAVAGVREAYRDRVRLGFDGRTETIAFAALAPTLQSFRGKVARGIADAEALTGGVPPTYFTYEVQDYEPLLDPDGRSLVDDAGRPLVRVKRFAQRVLPPFLEGPMHALRTRGDLASARALHEQIRASALYDAKLGMYKTNAPLADCSPEIGRLRAFTPGWLENESVFLHMAYKYLLEMLRAGLRDEFFAEMRRGLIPFLDPQTYGRSPLENSSFLVSSAHPDASLHGRGFVARLTGAAAELLSLWSLMMAGPQPFTVRDGELCLAFAPALPDWLFREDGTLSFVFLGQCRVTYHKAQLLRDGGRVASVILQLADGDRLTLAGGVIGAPYAAMVRSGAIRGIDMNLE
jgi:hypothetical protein